MDCSRQALPSRGFSRQNYRSGLPFLSPGYLPKPGLKAGLLPFRQTPYSLSHQESPQEVKKDIKNQLPLHLNLVAERNGKHGSGEKWNIKTYLGKHLIFDNSVSRRSSKVNILDPIRVQLSDNFHCLTQYILKWKWNMIHKISQMNNIRVDWSHKCNWKQIRNHWKQNRPTWFHTEIKLNSNNKNQKLWKQSLTA